MLKKPVYAILLGAFVAGSLDALAAILVYGPILGKASIGQIFRGISSGAFGKTAFEEGRIMAVYGILFHYFIALCFASFYFFIYPGIKFLKAQRILAGIIYGLFVWVIMNLVVLPLSKIPFRGFHAWPVLKAVLILVLMVGIPISIIIDAHFRNAGRKYPK